jgi:hypothetical protein
MNRAGHAVAERGEEGPPRRPRREPPVTDIFFVAGALVVVIGFILSLRLSWPSFDPLALAMLVGAGLLLIVICERLRLTLRELRHISGLLETLVRPGALDNGRPTSPSPALDEPEPQPRGPLA